MMLLADANIEAALVRWLLETGHDVVWVAELPPSTPESAGHFLVVSNRNIRVRPLP